MADNFEANAGSGGSTFAADDISSVLYQRIKLVLGADNTNDGDLALGNPLPLLDELAIARGVESTMAPVILNGRNVDVDTGADEDIWDGGGSWTQPTADRTHQIVSTSTDDDGSPAGTGAWTVDIEGISGGAVTSETVTLNGTSNVATAKSYSSIHKMKVATAGSGGSNAGTITATADSDSTVSCQITIGKNESQSAIYEVPTSKALYIVSFAAGVMLASSLVSVSLLVQPNVSDAPFQTKWTVPLMGAAASNGRHVFTPPLKISAGEVVKLRATTDTSNADVVAGFMGVLVG